MFPLYDIIVVGGGHAGCEAAAASARMGARVLLVTMNLDSIAKMSCNPAMGGVAKGQIVREIDALGGLSGIISDQSAVQFRMLNRSKGPAMWSPRTQNDRMRFSIAWRLKLETLPGLDFWQEMVREVLVKDGRITGVRTGRGTEIYASAVILTNGTFLNGIIHIGEKQVRGGRACAEAANGITEQLVSLGFETGRMKTGTSPRVDGRTLDYCKMEEQYGDENPSKFSFGEETQPLCNQRSCYLTHTNNRVHEILKASFGRSPLFSGRIRGKGPRYCPSIEDKIERFSERDRHQIFVEPEGWETTEVYINGFSTSLPEDAQFEAIRHIKGFEKAKILRPGYAIEYDYFPAYQLRPSLETQLIEGLYFAGQINGTTGYEEAACQGLMAGINAQLKINGKEPVVLSRAEAYIGVLLNDLVYKVSDEPYRMFTSRAEFRILLRQDNADQRLTPLGHKLGLISDRRLEQLRKQQIAVQELQKHLSETKLMPDQINPTLKKLNTSPIREKITIKQLVARPNIELKDILNSIDILAPWLSQYNELIQEQAVIQIKYANYIQKEKEFVDRVHRMESHKIPRGFNYNIRALSAEGREKLQILKPETLGQASNISGVSPSDIAVLLTFLSR